MAMAYGPLMVGMIFRNSNAVSAKIEEGMHAHTGNIYVQFCHAADSVEPAAAPAKNAAMEEELTTMAKSYVKRESLWHGTTMNSTNRIVCWKILSGTLPTSINKTRGRANRAEKMCKHCGNSAETTDIHILAECGKTRDLRNVRHNKIIAKELKLTIPDAAVQRDRTWRIGLVNLKPDITMKHENKITFVEVTNPYEKNQEALEQ